MITPLGWLERVPSYKEQQENLKGKDLSTYGFLGYPLLQAADILIYSRTSSRRPGSGRPRRTHPRSRPPLQPVLQMPRPQRNPPEPQVLLHPLTQTARHRRSQMSKSYGNTILLSDPEPEIRASSRPWSPTPPHPPHRPRQPRQMPRRRPAQNLLVPANPRQSLRRPAQPPASAASNAKAGPPTPSSPPRSHPGTPLALRTASRARRDIFNDGARRATARASKPMHEVRAAMGLPEQPPVTTRPAIHRALAAHDRRSEARSASPLDAKSLPPPTKKPPPTSRKKKNPPSPSPFPSARSTKAPTTSPRPSSAASNIEHLRHPPYRQNQPPVPGLRRALKASDVDTAGEFIYMSPCSSTSRARCFSPARPSNPGRCRRSRRELVERLLEHERFRNAAQMLQQKRQLEEATWTNPGIREFLQAGEDDQEIAATLSTSSASSAKSSSAPKAAPSSTSKKTPSPSVR